MLIHKDIQQVFTEFYSETLMMGLQIVTLNILVQRAQGTYPRSSAVDQVDALDVNSSPLNCESFFVESDPLWILHRYEFTFPCN